MNMLSTLSYTTYIFLYTLQRKESFKVNTTMGVDNFSFLPFWILSLIVAQSCPTLCDPMDCSMPCFPVLHYLPEFAQTHVHWINDAIQWSHPLSSPSPAFNLPQHQGLFQWVSSLYQVAKVLEVQLQHQSFQWIIQGWFPLGLTDLISLLFRGLSRVFSNTTLD